MRVLVTGATGILGRTVMQEAEKRRLEVVGTCFRRRHREPSLLRLDITQAADVWELLEQVRPEVIVNCAGDTASARGGSAARAWAVNALGPWVLAAAATRAGARLVHVSTDCVFRGAGGPYSETDRPDATEHYGQSKAAGEVTVPPHLTVRTSFVGPEVETERGLFAWFQKQEGVVPGYVNHLWSGVTSLCLARVLLDLGARPDVMGLLHVAGEFVTKADLLRLFRDALKRDVRVADVYAHPIDRRLRADRLRGLGIGIPPLAQQIREVVAVAAEGRLG